MKFLVLFIVLILSLPLGFALQVSPAEQTTTSSQEQTYTFTIRTTTQEPISIRLEGDLQEYAQAPNIITPSSTQETFDVTINPPQDLSPGRHELRIILSQQAGLGGNVAARAEIMPKITYIKTYEGSFLEPLIRPINDTQPLAINVLYQNLGEQATTATTTIDVANSAFVQDEQEILAATNVAQRYTINAPKGEYDLLATVQTSTQTLQEEHRVRIGRPEYELRLVESGRLQEIVPITLNIYSDWNIDREEEIKVTILANDTRYDLGEQTTTLSPEQNTLIVFWEGAFYGEHQIQLAIGRQEITKSFLLQELSQTRQLLSTMYLLLVALFLFVLSAWQLKRRNK